MSPFAHLLRPIMIGRVQVPNRICHVPTDISSSHIDGSVSGRDIAHHETIARGGAGFIVVGATSPNRKTNRSTVTNIVADDDTHIPGLARLAAAIHRYGAKCAVQLSSTRDVRPPSRGTGRSASNDVAMNLPWSQSHAIVHANADEKQKTVHVLTTDEVIEIVEEFSEAAWRVMQAGFDAVELHAAHGYLISQFMSPYLNHRTDRFGGTFENRMRFPLAIVQSIQSKCGTGLPCDRPLFGGRVGPRAAGRLPNPWRWRSSSSGREWPRWTSASASRKAPGPGSTPCSTPRAGPCTPRRRSRKP